MNYLEIFEQYLRKSDKHLTEKNIRIKCEYVDKFSIFLRRHYFRSCLDIDSIPWENVDSERVKHYLKSLEGDLKEGALNQRRRAFKDFFHCLDIRDIVDINETNPVAAVPRYKTVYQLPELLIPVAEVIRLLEYLPDDIFGIRDRAVLETIYSTFWRVGELAAVKLDNLYFEKDMDPVNFEKDTGNILILKKDGTKREGRLGSSAVAAIRKYLDIRGQLGDGPSTDHIFISNKGQHMESSDLSRIVRRYAEFLWPGLGITSTTIRLSGMVHMYMRGENQHNLNINRVLEDIRDMAGDSSAYTFIMRWLQCGSPSPEQIWKSRSKSCSNVMQSAHPIPGQLKAEHSKAHPHAQVHAKQRTSSSQTPPKLQETKGPVKTTIDDSPSVSPKGWNIGISGALKALPLKDTKRDNETDASYKDLLDAIEENNVGRLRFLINKGTDINASDRKGVTPLMVAASKGKESIVELLLDNNAKVNMRDKTGSTALRWASCNGHTEIVKTLLENGAEINIKTDKGQTALICAATNGHTDTVEILLHGGADINVKDNNRWTALKWADTMGHTETVHLLKEAGVKE